MIEHLSYFFQLHILLGVLADITHICVHFIEFHAHISQVYVPLVCWCSLFFQLSLLKTIYIVCFLITTIVCDRSIFNFVLLWLYMFVWNYIHQFWTTLGLTQVSHFLCRFKIFDFSLLLEVNSLPVRFQASWKAMSHWLTPILRVRVNFLVILST